MNYEINEETLAIVPYMDKESIIYEYNEDIIINNSPYKIMETSCEYFGSSINGRLVGSKNMLGTIYKVPLLVEESSNLIFFPTKSPSVDDNAWISLKSIKYYEKSANKTIITFTNNKKIEIDVPYSSINNQILRATRLESIINTRKNLKKTVKN